MKKIYKNLFFFIFLIGFLLLILELISGLILSISDARAASDINKSFSSELELYSEYEWHKEFLDEKRSNPGPSYSYFPYVMWNTKNWESKFINFDSNGVRKTINDHSIKSDVYRIYMFGGSTMENTEVPDEYTIASNVSSILSDSDYSNRYRFEVVNFGSGAYSSTQQLIRLIFEAQREFKDYGKPNLVIFYDGVNDVFNGVYLERPGIHDAYDRIKLRYDHINKFYLLKIREWLANKSKTYELINYLLIEDDSKHRYFQNRDLNYQKYAIESLNIYRQNINLVKALGNAYDFDSIFFLQPQIFSSKELTLYDSNIRKKWNKKHPQMAEAYKAGYSEFRKLVDSKLMIDLTGVFDGSKKPIYKDHCHVGPYANMLVSKSISEQIMSNIKLNSKLEIED